MYISHVKNDILVYFKKVSLSKFFREFKNDHQLKHLFEEHCFASIQAVIDSMFLI